MKEQDNDNGKIVMEYKNEKGGVKKNKEEVVEVYHRKKKERESILLNLMKRIKKYWKRIKVRGNPVEESYRLWKSC